MNPSLWTVEFSTELSSGGGVIIFLPGRILGGDATYYYDGTVIIEGESITCEVEVKAFRGEPASVFGPLQALRIRALGKYKEPIMILDGHLIADPNKKVTITCTKRFDLSQEG